MAVDAVNNTGIDHLNFILRMETDNPTAAITLLGWGNGLVVRQSLNRLFWVYFLCQRDDRVLVVFKLAVCP
ncbi:hypothetical protein IFO70_30575 [Phormidium tenue FACHB-886]|nr:hypothetical protein [Phormidium tenue FACHB-886]